MGSYVSSLAGRLYQSPEDFLASVSTSGAYSEVSLDDDEDDLEDELASLEGSAFGTPEWKQLIGLIPKPAGLQLQPHYKHEKQDPKHRMGDLLEECFKVYTQQNPGDPDGAQLYQWLDAMSDWDRLMLIANNPLVRDPAKRVEAGLPAGRAAHSDVDRRGNIKPSMVKAFMKGVAYLDKAGRKRRKVIFRGGTAYGVDEKGIEIALDTAQLQTVFSGKGFGIWVMSEKGKLYVGNHIKGLIHHSSFLAGAKVMCGGELKAQTGKIQLLSGKSGHYNPGIEHLVWALNVLRTCVDNFDQIKVVVWRANAVNLVSPGQLIGNAHLYKSWGNLTADEKARLARGDFAGFPRLTGFGKMEQIVELAGTAISRFRIIEEIGHGGMGRVYKALDTGFGRLVAVKVIAEKHLSNLEVLKRFEREGRAAAALKHPHICTIYEVGAWRGQPFIAMELLQGETVKDRIRRRQLFERPELMLIALQIAGALEAAHAKDILHRDVKPSNVFLKAPGQAKLLDFGLAKILAPKPTQALTATMDTLAMSFATIPGAILGTIAYMAPEQARGMPVDARADLYSLGVMLHEMATGELPLGGAASPRLPLWLRAMVQKLIAAAPGDRYQSASALRAELSAMPQNEQAAGSLG